MEIRAGDFVGGIDEQGLAGMSLLLAIESSSNINRIILGRDSVSVFDSAQQNFDAPIRTLGSLLSCGLESMNVNANDIAGITVDIGPGSLTFVRAGISFVNALAFSLGIKIYPFNSFEIVAEQTNAATTLPVVYAIPAANDNAYVGLIKGTSVEIMRFGALPITVAQISRGLKEVAVAGRIRDRLSSLLQDTRVVDTGVESPDAQVLHQLGFQAIHKTVNAVSHVEALNDQSPLFYE
jgi:tRNA A37 threonylcarbamoyladenosine modification protein TsaB